VREKRTQADLKPFPMVSLVMVASVRLVGFDGNSGGVAVVAVVGHRQLNSLAYCVRRRSS